VPDPATATDALAALVRRCPPAAPAAGGQPGDWDAVTVRLGSPLSADSRGFVDAYGLVRLDDFLLVHSPFAPPGPGHLLHEVSDPYGSLAGYAERRAASPDGALPPPFPAPGGALPAGRTDNGDELWWLAEGDPDGWPVAVLEARGRVVRTVAPSLAALLLGLVERRIRLPEFPESFPGADPRFVPAVPGG
jgi:hypothetical protein